MPSIFSQDPYQLSKSFIYKTIRADDDDFWDDFIEGLFGKKQALRGAMRRMPWTARLSRPDSLTGERKLEAVETTSLEPLFDPETKKYFSSPQSTSYAAPAEGYQPAAFGQGTLREDALVGIRVTPEDTLIHRIMMYDEGTIARTYDFRTKAEVDAYISRVLSGREWFNTLDELAHYGKRDPKKHNEVMTRLSWNLDGSSQIVIFSDNLTSRILAQLRAKDLQLAIDKTLKDDGLAPEELIAVPMSFYKSLKYYEAQQQIKDLTAAKTNPSLRPQVYLLELLSSDSSIAETILDEPAPEETLKQIIRQSLVLSPMGRFFLFNKLFNDKSIAHLDLDLKKIISELMTENPKNYGRIYRTLSDCKKIDSTDIEFIASMINPEWDKSAFLRYLDISKMPEEELTKILQAINPLTSDNLELILSRIKNDRLFEFLLPNMLDLIKSGRSGFLGRLKDYQCAIVIEHLLANSSFSIDDPFVENILSVLIDYQPKAVSLFFKKIQELSPEKSSALFEKILASYDLSKIFGNFSQESTVQDVDNLSMILDAINFLPEDRKNTVREQMLARSNLTIIMTASPDAVSTIVAEVDKLPQERKIAVFNKMMEIKWAEFLSSLRYFNLSRSANLLTSVERLPEDYRVQIYKEILKVKTFYANDDYRTLGLFPLILAAIDRLPEAEQIEELDKILNPTDGSLLSVAQRRPEIIPLLLRAREKLPPDSRARVFAGINWPVTLTAVEAQNLFKIIPDLISELRSLPDSELKNISLDKLPKTSRYILGCLVQFRSSYDKKQSSKITDLQFISDILKTYTQQPYTILRMFIPAGHTPACKDFVDEVLKLIGSKDDRSVETEEIIRLINKNLLSLELKPDDRLYIHIIYIAQTMGWTIETDDSGAIMSLSTASSSPLSRPAIKF
jgi:hypothetical protein